VIAGLSRQTRADIASGKISICQQAVLGVQESDGEFPVPETDEEVTGLHPQYDPDDDLRKLVRLLEENLFHYSGSQFFIEEADSSIECEDLPLSQFIACGRGKSPIAFAATEAPGRYLIGSVRRFSEA
jgi:hypothetical protein